MTDFDRWFHSSARPNVRVPLKELVLERGDGVRCEGAGTIVCSLQESTLTAVTSSNATFRSAFHGLLRKPGKLLQVDDYFSLDGVTPSGMQVESRWISDEDTTYFSDKEAATWNARLHGIQLGDPDQAGHADHLHALVSDVARVQWTKVTSFTSDNPHFSDSLFKRDWMEFEFNGLTVVARQIGDEDALVRLTSESPRPDLADQLQALTTALAFATGRQPQCVLTKMSGSSGSLYRWNALRDGKRSYHACPTDGGHAPDEFLRILKSSATFFATELGKSVANHLYQSWDSVDNTMSLRTLALSSSVEGLLKLMLQPSGRFKVATWMRRAADAGLFGLSGDDIKAWVALRDVVAHGGLLWTDDCLEQKQQTITQLDRMKSLQIKIVLELIGERVRAYDRTEHRSVVFEPVGVEHVRRRTL